jgi:hypothetical protein
VQPLMLPPFDAFNVGKKIRLALPWSTQFF